MKITYQADDGYLGKDRPLHCKVDDSDITDCESVDEAMEMISEAIQDAFEQRVQAGWDQNDVRKEVEELFKNK